MKLLFCAVIASWLFPMIASARLIAHWPYLKLFQGADLVAVVELESIKESDEKLGGRGNKESFEGKVARLRIGVLLKGHCKTRTIDLLHFVYAKDVASINGALFLDFSDAEKHQYLVFLKRGRNNLYVPVAGQYDAELSVKKITKDYLSPIGVADGAGVDPKAQRLEAVPLPLEGAVHLARAFLEKKKMDSAKHTVESAILQSDRAGKHYWDVKWSDRDGGKGSWFIVRVGLDGTTSLIRGK